ncbi:MAG: phospho-sugar mutase [Bacilli bacterium]
MNAQEKHLVWLNSEKVSREDKQILRAMTEEEIEDSFFADIAFGTAGMRGRLGPGTNRINFFTIQRAAVGFALYLLEKFEDATTRGVAISHDNRHFSREFTLLSARVLNAYGIKAYIFPSLRPTPLLSYAVRYSGCVGGIMITASHNPKEDNGFKVYDEDGAQLVPEKIDRLIAIIERLPNYLEIELPEKIMGITETYDSEIEEAYIRDVLKIQLQPKLPKDNFRVVFTPQHGAGAELGRRLLKEVGYETYVVAEQMTPDPDFSMTPTPNPEDKRAYERALKLARQKKAHLIMATDPDADRVGIVFLDRKGEYQFLNGNQSGALLINYLLSIRSALGLLSLNSRLYTTIVTSPLGPKIAARFGIKTELFPTGFKFIGHAVSNSERENGPTFAFGYEESYGCLIAPIARDKDALQAVVMYAEMTNHYLQKDQYLDEVLEDIHQEFGYYEDPIDSIVFEGAQGKRALDQLLADLRENPLTEIAGIKVVACTDFLKGVVRKPSGEYPLNFEVVDVIRYELETGDRVIIRPSGTEPKGKIYYSIVRATANEAKTARSKLQAAMRKIISNYQ